MHFLSILTSIMMLTQLPQKAALADWKAVIKLWWWWWLLQVWCGHEQRKSVSSAKWHWKVNKMIQNYSIGSEWLTTDNITVALRLAGQKNSSSHFKLNLCCLLPNISPHTKLIKIRWKPISWKKFLALLVSWVGQKISIAISNSFYDGTSYRF